MVKLSMSLTTVEDQTMKLTPSVGAEFKDYSFSSRELPPFTKFQIKIDMVGTDTGKTTTY